MTQKTCRQCLTLKDISQFYKHKAMADGYLNKCKDCVKNRVNNHRQENLERIQAYDRKRADLPHRVESRKAYAKTSSYRTSCNAANQKYKQAYPDKAKARSLVRYAVLTGSLIKQPCCICGDIHSEAHHEDYNKPLDVIWYCDKHHKQRHRFLNAEKRLIKSNIG